MRKLITIIFVLFLFIKIYAQSDEEQRALWVFNLAYGTTWENESEIDTFTIGVFSSEEDYKAYQNLAQERSIKGKPVKVYKYENYKNFKQHHIVSVSKSENAYLGFVYEKFKGKNDLILSDRSHQLEYSVFNFNDLKETRKLTLNTQLADIQKLRFSDQIIKLAGNREDLQYIFAKTDKELRDTKKELDEIKLESAKKDIKIGELEKEIYQLKEKIKQIESDQ